MGDPYPLYLFIYIISVQFFKQISAHTSLLSVSYLHQLYQLYQFNLYYLLHQIFFFQFPILLLVF